MEHAEIPRKLGMTHCLSMAISIVQAAILRRDSIAKGLESGFLDATTMMELPIAQGMLMLSAHEVVGRLVRSGEQRRFGLTEMPPKVNESVLPCRAHAVYEV